MLKENPEKANNKIHIYIQKYRAYNKDIHI